MKYVKLLGNGSVVIDQAPEPQIRAVDDVKIKVYCTSICSDDTRWFLGPRQDIYINKSIGHEFSGYIEDAGDAARDIGFVKGTRVSGYTWCFCGKCPYCREGKENMCINMGGYIGAMGEYIVLKDRQLCILPPELSMESGCLTELVASCIHGIDRAELKIGQSVLINGAGGAGLVLLQLAKMQGVVNLTVNEPLESKRLLAKKMGADYVINHENDNLYQHTTRITDQLGYDCIFDASGDDAFVDALPSIMAKRGMLILFSFYNPNGNPIKFDASELYVKEGTIKASYMAPFMLDRAMKIISSLNLDDIIGIKFQMSDAQKAFETSLTQQYPRVMLYIEQ